MKGKYRLYKRKGEKAWRFYFYTKSGKRLFRKTEITTKARAEEHADKYVAEYNREKRETPTLTAFTQTFFLWGECEWIKAQMARGRSFSTTQAKKRRSQLNNWILPEFGDRRLDDIRRFEVEDWLVKLPLANQTKNHVLHTFRTVMREAERQEHVELSVLERVEPMGNAAKPRDAFTLEDLAKLFPKDEDDCLRIWLDFKHYAAFLTFATSGLRSGELRPLRWSDYHDGALFVTRAIKADDTLGKTKTEEARVVLLPTRTIDVLDRWQNESLFPKSTQLMFYGEGPDRPWSRLAPMWALRKAMPKAKIDISGRTLVVHSFRHAYKTILRKSVPEETLRALTGHKTKSMTDHYTHNTLVDRLQYLEPSRALIDSVWE